MSCGRRSTRSTEPFRTAGRASERNASVFRGFGALLISVGGGRVGEVVGGLVDAGFLLLDLAEKIIQQRTGAEAIAPTIQPVVAEGLFHCHEEVERLLRRADAAGGL